MKGPSDSPYSLPRPPTPNGEYKSARPGPHSSRRNPTHGIARVAQGRLCAKHRWILHAACHSWLNRCGSTGSMPCTDRQPYAAANCLQGGDARYTEFMEMAATGLDFEREDLLHVNTPRVFWRHICGGQHLQESIALGTRDRSYQPAERRYETTREFGGVRPDTRLRFGQRHEVNLIVRDLDCCRKARRPTASPSTSRSPHRCRFGAPCLSPVTPRPDLRMGRPAQV